jgi:nicotinamide-nucleotide amidase
MNDILLLLFKLKEKLVATNQIVATAESCTGGLLAAYLTELPGSSAWFERGFVTYSNLAKQEMLGIDPELIVNYGAVSKQVAEAMVIGALQHSHATIAVSITGIAGPDGGSAKKPVGTVHFGFSMKNKMVQHVHCCFPYSSRQQIRLAACRSALSGLIALLDKQN